LVNSLSYLGLFRKKNAIFVKRATTVSMVLLKLFNAQKEITAQWGPKSLLTAQPLAITQILEAKMLSSVSLAKEATIVMMMLLATFSNMEMTISAR
jgi:hypothetical protein